MRFAWSAPAFHPIPFGCSNNADIRSPSAKHGVTASVLWLIPKRESVWAQATLATRERRLATDDPRGVHLRLRSAAAAPRIARWFGPRRRRGHRDFLRPRTLQLS